MIPYNIEIRIDFLSDLVSQVKEELNSVDLKLKNMNQSNSRELFFQYADLKRKLILPSKRQVHYSDCFSCPSKFEKVLTEIHTAFENGTSITKYLSRQVLN